MNSLEPLCHPRMIKADYPLVCQGDREPDHCFRIRVISRKQDLQVDVSQEDGELFASELEALAAIVRSRVIRARLVANA